MIKKFGLLLGLMLVASVAGATTLDMRSRLKCDDVTDDGPALQQLSQTCGATITVLDFSNVINACRINEGITVDGPCVRFKNAVLDFRSVPANTTAITVGDGQDGDYANGQVAWDGVHLMGNGSGIGLLVEDNHHTFNNFVIHGFAEDVQLGQYAFSLGFNNPFLYDAHIDFNCPQANDAGEQIVINGGALFNSAYGVMGGGCGMTMTGTSIDGMTAESISWWGGGFRAYGVHIENFASPTGAIIQNAGGNSYSFMDFEGLEVFQDSGSATLQLIKNPSSGATINLLGHTTLSGSVK